MSASSSRPKLSLQNSSLMALTPEQTEIETFITQTILPSGVPILEDIDIPQPTGNVFPESGFGTGYISSDGQFAIKNIDYGKMIKNSFVSIEGVKELLTNELINYHAISNKCPEYFCKLIGYKYNNKTRILTIKMENCGKDLFEIYSKKDDNLVEDNVIRDHIGQLLNILNCLHDNGYVHYDLKLDNIVMDDNGILKLIDAGTLTKINDPETVFVRGTKEYIAPELKNRTKIENNELLKATDIYSLGIIFIIMIFPLDFGGGLIFDPVLYYPDGTIRKAFKNIFELWQYLWLEEKEEGYDSPNTNINKYFKKYFGDDISYNHFFSETPGERLTIQDLLSRFNTKMKADIIEYKKAESKEMAHEKAESKIMAYEKEEANKKEEFRPPKRSNDNQDEVFNFIPNNAKNANNDDIILSNGAKPNKKGKTDGGNKSKKPRRKRNNKSKRRQRKSRSK
jgi:serine/threonine protein kinase